MERKSINSAFSESESYRVPWGTAGEWNDLLILPDKHPDVAMGFYENRGGRNFVISDDRLRLVLGISEKQTSYFYEFWEGHLYPDDRERVIALRREIQENKLDNAFAEYRYRHPQRGLLWLNHVVHVMERDPHGKVLHLIGMIWDVTESKRMAGSLEQSQIEIAAIINSTEDLIWLVDAERFGLITWNRAFRDHYINRYGIEIDVGMSPDQLLPEYAAQWRAFYELALRDGSFDTEYVVQDQRNVILLSFQVLKRDNHVFGISVFGKDITKIKQAEHKLRESQERLNMAAEAAEAGLWTLDLATEVFWLSKTTRALFAFPPEGTVTFENFMRVVHPEHRQQLYQAVERARKSKEEISVQYRIICPDGTIRWISSRGRIQFSESAGANLLMGVSVDITNRKHTEKQLLASQEALRGFAGKLLAIQEEERRRLARELHDDFTQRLAVLAMDMSMLEAAAKSAGKTVQSKLTSIRNQIVNLSTDIHDVSRQLHPSIIDDLGLGSAIQSECSNFTRRTGIVVAYTQTDVPRTISRDISVVLFRITQEALRNIHKHAHVNEAEVCLACENNQLLLGICDSGEGFDPENIRQTHGLGLFSMEERVQLVRGIFSIDSAPKQGTRINVMVPLIRSRN